VTVSLTRKETQALLQRVPAAFQSRIYDVLVTAFAGAISSWTGGRSVLIDLERHGREDIFEDVDLTRTMGWLTTIFPVELSLEKPDSPLKALSSIQEQLQRIPNNGIGYGVLRYLGDDEETTARLLRLPQAEVTFNYLGQFDQIHKEASLLTFAQEDTGPVNTLQRLRSHLLEVTGYIAGERLSMNWIYSQNLHERATIERVAQRFLEELRLLILKADSGEL